MKNKLTDVTKHSIVKKLMAAGISAAMLMSVTPAQANNPPPAIKADAPNRYVVKKGDTLWDISGRYLKSPWKWREIWAANKQVKNPHLIYPGDILLMCVIKGETLVGIDTGEGCAGIERNMTAPVATADAPAASNVTITPLDNSIPPFPLSFVEHWLDKVLIVNPDDFETTPYVLASKKGNLITGIGDKIYIKGVPLIVGQQYGVYRKGQPYVDPVSKQVIGLEVTQVATGRVTSVAANGISSFDILGAYDSEVREGDRVFVEISHDIPPVFYPKPASVNRGGKIARILDSISNAAAGSVIAINLGTENGAEPGDVFTVLKHGALIRDVHDDDAAVRLPDEEVGHVMVFKTFDKISYAYVLDSELPLSVGDRLVPPSE